MRVSWAQHSTVVAQRSRAEIRNLFREAGTPTTAEGKSPLLLGDPTMSWFVDAGALDLFLVDVVKGVPTGRRFHFVRVESNELVLGIDPLPSRTPDLSFGILAVGITGTRIFALERERTIEQAKKSFFGVDALHGSVDVWIRRLSSGLSDRELPPNRVEILPGDQVELEVGAIATAGQKTLWFSQLEGTSRLVGVSPVGAKAKAMLPLTRETWIEVDSNVRLSVVDTEAYFRFDPSWSSISRFHRFVLDCLARRAQASREAESAQLLARDEVAKSTMSAALTGLAAIEGGERVASARDAPPIVLACQAIGRAIGVEMKNPGAVPGGARVEDVASASKLRVRAVVLPKDWMKVVREPVLGFFGKIDHPVAIIPRPFSGLDLYDPTTGERKRCTPVDTAELSPQAYVFYRPLPARSLTIVDVLKFAAFNSVADLSVLILTGLALGGFGMVVPWATGKMIDELIPSADQGPLIHVGILMFVVAASTACIQIVRSAALLRLEMRSSSSLQAAVWDRLLALPVPFFRKFSAADLAIRANSIETLRQVLAGGALSAILTSISSMLNFGVMVAYDGVLAFAAALLALGSVLIALVVGVTSVLVRRRLAELEGKVSSLVLQLLSGIAKLRVAGAERRAFTLWARLFSEKRGVAFASRRIESRMAVVVMTWPTIMSVVIFSMAAGSTTLGTGDFLAFNAAFGIFVAGLVELVRTSVELLQLVPVVERAKSLFEEKPEVDEHKSKPGRLRGGIQVSHVSFRYAPDGPLILDDVDFEIAPGEFVALVGASAAGKSTLLRMMLGFEKAESGGVYYDRQELSSLDITEVRRQIGVVLQSGQPVAGDIMENIFASRRLTIDDAWQAARAAGLAEDIEKMPMKMHTVLGQGAPSLSGGQRQRLMIARAIVTKPRILFFDEATSALDNATQAHVTQSLERLQATRVVVAHRLSTIVNADRIVVMDRGRVVQIGTYLELMEVDGVFRDIAKRQTT